MSFHSIPPTQARVMRQLIDSDQPEHRLPAEHARKHILEIAQALRTRSGSVRSGYLRLVRREDGRMDFTLANSRHRERNQDFTEFAKELIRQAYPDHHQKAEVAIDRYLAQHSHGKFGSQSFVKLVVALERAQHDDAGQQHPDSAADPLSELAQGVRAIRLRQGGFFSAAPRIDTSTLERDLLASVDGQLESNPGTEYEVVDFAKVQERANTEVGSIEDHPQYSNSIKDASVLRPESSSPVQHQDALPQQPAPVKAAPLPPLASLNLPSSELRALQMAGYQQGKLLGQGGVGEAYLVERPDGQRSVYKRIEPEMRGYFPVTLDRQLSLSGGYLTYLKSPSKNAPGYDKHGTIVAPTHLLVSQGEQTPPTLLPVQDIRAALKQKSLDEGHPVSMVLLGEISELALGDDLYQPGRTTAYAERDQKAILEQLVDMAAQNRQRGIVHRDLKGENIKFDRHTQKLGVFDWDMSYKISKKTSNPTALPSESRGTEQYMHPSALAGQPCGFEGDVHAIAMIALENRYPNLMESVQLAMAVQTGLRSNVDGSQQRLNRDPALPISFKNKPRSPVTSKNYMNTMRRLVFDLAERAPQAIKAARSNNDSELADLWQRRLDDAVRLIDEAGWGERGNTQAHPLVQATIGLLEDGLKPATDWLDKHRSTEMLQQRLAQVRAYQV